MTDERSPSQHALCLVMLERLERGRLHIGQWLFRELLPDVMAKVKESIPMHLGFGDVKVGADQGDQNGIENVVDKFVK